MSTIDNLIAQFASTGVEESPKDVSFAGMGLQLNTEKDAEHIAVAIEGSPGMTSLRLEGNTVGVPAAKVIGKALETQSLFKHAYWKDMFTGRDKSEIPEALDHLSRGMMIANAKLVVLDLSDNAFGPRGLVGIQKLLESPCCYTLQELHLNNNGLGISGAKMLSTAICNCIENSKKMMSLKIFVCGRNRLENEGAIAVSKFIKQLGSLVSVAMPQNGIYPPGIKALSDAFESNQNLKVINLEDNSLTEEGAKCISRCLPHLDKLEMLNLGDCLVRAKGAMSLVEVLKNSCSNLVEINLGFNEINLDSGIMLVDAMSNKNRLQRLNLNGNQFGDDGCMLIQERMQNFGKGEFLSSLSEDEGDVDEEEDDEDDDDEEEETDEDGGSDSQDETPQQSINNILTPDKLTHRSPMSKIVFADFVASPNAHALVQLAMSNEDYSGVLPNEPSVSDYLELFVKISSVVTLDDDDATAAACKFSDDILTKAYGLCAENVSRFNDEFLIAVGLLKGEDKKPKKGLDISGILLVLAHALRQEYFHTTTKDTLQFFLSRPLQYVSASGKSTHVFMQTLYQM